MTALVLALSGGCAPKPIPPPPPPGSGTVVELTTNAISTADHDAILRAVSSAAVRPCFEALIAARPTLYGEVVVRFTVAPTGGVEWAEPDFSTLGDAVADTCIAEAVKAVPFAVRDMPITVLYPFLLLTERTPSEVARALKSRYGLLSESEATVDGDPRIAPPPGVIVLW